MSKAKQPEPIGDYGLVVVSNRLPVDFVVDEDGVEGWRSSPGGLVTALEPVMRESDGAWVGWAGVADRELDPFEHDGISIIPVPLSEEDLERYYEGFSNDTLWPLYHDVIAPPSYHREWWESYVTVNRRFATAAGRAAALGATVWVHDYQLQLVPAMLRAIRPDLVIGFFNHIPFPPYGIYSQLPWRKQILEGLLGADVIGFQRVADAGNFTRAVRRLLGYTTRHTVVEVPGDNGDLRRVVATNFPISIDVAGFEELAARPDIQARALEIRAGLGNPETVMLGVDRLDYTKGIGHRLKAYGELLAQGRLDVEKTVLVQVASPSRERVATYMSLRDEIELQVGRLNGDHSTLSHTAIAYLHQAYPREEMVALYLAADVMLVTALRDGMNLVAKEYVASRINNDGVLVLSEFAGASDELKQALLINPHDIEGLKNAIESAARMPSKERKKRMKTLRKRLRENNVSDWAKAFLDMLTGRAAIEPGIPEALVTKLREVAATPRLLIALDFDGTLAPHVDRPEEARALESARAAVMRLIALPETRVAFVSGRALVSLEQVAEPPESVLLTGSHGIEMKLDQPGISLDLLSEEIAQLATLAEILDGIAARAEGVWVERKPAGFALHTRLVPTPVGQALQRTARGAVTSALPSLTVLEGKNVLEFSVRDGNKGDALKYLREYTHATSVFYAGDDVTDENAFAVQGADDLSLKIGQGFTVAGNRVRGPEELAEVLALLADFRASQAGALDRARS
ncbi:bifunctional alpha,alpha-trehalose-phosphate synthase (UDP-forming)/trehalose-phosphatase [Microterricola viridarii]|uniref:bifunctional alpha,alpha-trehalose-phosphate synthase (UDP-forming)/trehalose-phosphatase n=1 Tax=Microterricola viridarii TaxID=412690 RepID=UPI000AA135D5|nr:bifunctional alpha,alpha-trehalose-phosphate synthase (UDP-forming)/trehalose-phosphatase [Microterricola viridarii]